MEQKDYIINQLALAKAQLEVNLLEATWTIKQLEEELAKTKVGDE